MIHASVPKRKRLPKEETCMTITAVALDLDGTLLPRGTHRLSARTVAVLRAV